MAHLSDGSGAARFALKSIQSIALCGAVTSALNSLIGGEYPHSKVRQKSTGDSFACALALTTNKACRNYGRLYLRQPLAMPVEKNFRFKRD